MSPDASLAHGIRAAGYARRHYDAICKRLLSERQVLARILAGCLEEYENLPLDVVEACIEGDPLIGEEPVERDGSAARINGLPTDDTTVGEGTVLFDILFDAVVPDTGGEMVRLVINVEAQNAFDPGYPLLRRALYYCGRLLSRQGASNVVGSHYERVRKVCSVWVCTAPRGAFEGTISRFSLSHEHLVGDAPYRRADWDLIEVVMVSLSPEMRSAKDGLLGFLGTLLGAGTTPQERLDILNDEFGLTTSEQISDEVNDMCNLSEGIWLQGKAEGLAEGLAEGKAEGLAEGLAESIVNLMDSLSLSADRAMDALKIPAEERHIYIEKIAAGM